MKSITTFVFALTGMCFCSIINLHAQFSGGGTGTSADPFQIKTANDINNVRNYVGTSNADKHFRLMNDIDLTAFLKSSTAGWLPIGDNNNRFTGYFHGGGHTISGLWIDRSNTDYIGLFGANQGTIDSLGVDILNKEGYYTIIGRYHVGGLIAYNCIGSKVNECHVTGGSVSSHSDSYLFTYCGVLIGYNDGGSVTNCYSTNKSDASGGFSSSVCSGGLIGYNTGTVNNCYAAGVSSFCAYIVTGEVYSGGFVGYNAGIINNCYASGNISLGGCTPSIQPITPYVGGFVGKNEGKISNCYATGEVPAFYGSATYFSGGFVGYLSGGTILNCYAVGQVGYKYATGSFGTFVGRCDIANFLSQCYYNSDINGSLVGVGNSTGSENVFGKTTSEMQMQSTFVNWDFSTVWTIKEGSSYPYFQWQDTTLPTGIQFVQKDGNTMAIFPNPATDNITISGLQNNETIRLYNLNGQLMLTRKATGETETIAIGNLPAGIYFVKTEMGKTLKWVKK